MSDEFDEADEKERAEAAALAAALEGEARAEAPEDALATALLVRHGGARGELSQERAEAILGGLLREAKSGSGAATPAVGGKAAGAKVVRPWPRVGVLAAAAAVMLGVAGSLVLRRDRASSPASIALAPQPSSPAAQPLGGAPPAAAWMPRAGARLLAAHSAWLRTGLSRDGSLVAPAIAQDAETAARFERELRAYREQLFRGLQAEYPAKLGLLERSPRRPP